MQPATHKPLFRLTEVPYFVAADHRHKKIVVAIRGTLSLADALTDLAAKPVPLADDPGRQKVIFLRKVSLKTHQTLSDTFADNPGDLEGMEAHGGMVRAARYVFAELRDKNILNKAFSYFDGYTVSAAGFARSQCFHHFFLEALVRKHVHLTRTT